MEGPRDRSETAIQRVCLIADTHRQHRQVAVPPCDLLIHCGDFCSFRRDDRETLADADAWFGELPAQHVVCVGGNHDYLLENGEFRFTHATLLEDEGIEIEGLSIWGSPWCPDLPGFAFHLDADGLAERWRRIPTGIDILVTHTPAHGILDVPSSGRIHLGCPRLREELRRIRPGLHVFGHVHASRGSFVDEGTNYVNAAVVGGSNLEVRHPCILKEISPAT